MGAASVGCGESESDFMAIKLSSMDNWRARWRLIARDFYLDPQLSVVHDYRDAWAARMLAEGAEEAIFAM